MQEAVVGAHEHHLAPLGMEVREVDVRRARPARRQVRGQVRVELRRLEQQRLGVEDVAELVRVARRRIAVVVGLLVGRIARLRGIVLVEVRVLLLLARVRADHSDRQGTDGRVVQDLVAASIRALAAAQELDDQLRARLVGQLGGRQAHVRHELGETVGRVEALARSRVRQEVGAGQGNACRVGGEDHLAARPDRDRRRAAGGDRRNRTGGRSEIGDRVRVAEHAAGVPHGLTLGRIGVVRIAFVHELARDRRRRGRRDRGRRHGRSARGHRGHRGPRRSGHDRQETVGIELEALQRAAPHRPARQIAVRVEMAGNDRAELDGVAQAAGEGRDRGRREDVGVALEVEDRLEGALEGRAVRGGEELSAAEGRDGVQRREEGRIRVQSDDVHGDSLDAHARIDAVGDRAAAGDALGQKDLAQIARGAVSGQAAHGRIRGALVVAVGDVHDDVVAAVDGRVGSSARRRRENAVDEVVVGVEQHAGHGRSGRGHDHFLRILGQCVGPVGRGRRVVAHDRRAEAQQPLDRGLGRIAARVVRAQPLAAERHDRPVVGARGRRDRVDVRRPQQAVRRSGREALEGVEVRHAAAIHRVRIAAARRDAEGARGRAERVVRELLHLARTLLVVDRGVHALVVAVRNAPRVGHAVRVAVRDNRAARARSDAGAPGRVAVQRVVRGVDRRHAVEVAADELHPDALDQDQ